MTAPIPPVTPGVSVWEDPVLLEEAAAIVRRARARRLAREAEHRTEEAS